jgi:serine-protein kinase ATM
VGVRARADVSSKVYRLISMWFANDQNCGEEVDTIMSTAVKTVPSFRFVPLVSQLVSRIDHTASSPVACFQGRLQELIQVISLAHPYHCLIHLLTIAEGSTTRPLNEKSKAAQAILLNLEKADPFVEGLVESYRKLATAYIHLALASTSDYKRGTDNLIPFDHVCKGNAERLDRCLGVGFRKMKFLPCILTKPPLLNPRGDYGNGIEDPVGSERVHSFEGAFAITDSGVNQPKIVVCFGASGGRFKQLVKGNDDTRQDAVMEQVFDFANSLMAHNKIRGRSNHKLNLVTYCILPLSHRAGVSGHTGTFS